MTENIKEYNCLSCNKKYASIYSLSNHNKKFHKKTNNLNPMTQNITLTNQESLTKKCYKCDKCNRLFNNYQNRWKHSKICKNNMIIIKQDTKIEQLENKIAELEIKLNNSNITNYNNNNNINNGIINNTTNNIVKVSFGSEDIFQLSIKDKKKVLNKGFGSLLKLIETMHLNNDYKQFQNVSITNLTNKYAKYYDDTNNNYITKNKKEIIDEIIFYRTSNLKGIHDEYNKNTLMHNNVLKLIKKLESYNPENKNDDLYKFYKELCTDITMLFYNKSKIFK